MSDGMTFPDTVEEFMEKYKVVDTDHVYSNGVEFVPIYRMNQWFEHQPKCSDGERKIDENSFQLTETQLDLVFTVACLASGTTYYAGLKKIFKDDDIDHTKFHKWQHDHICNLLRATGLADYATIEKVCKKEEEES